MYYQANIHSLYSFVMSGEIRSAQKQVEVLSKTAVSDADVEVERKLDSLKEDFEKRLASKVDESADKMKRLVREYEAQLQDKEANYQV